MNLFKSINADLNAAQRFGLANKVALFFFNRGVHALLWYRVANMLARLHIPLIPFLISRVIQIIYAIDIDFRAKLSPGVVIVHGVGLVIGQNVVVEENAIIFHGVTLGRRGVGPIISLSDGYPIIEANCILCAGAKIVGKITIGEGSIIGANCVVSTNIAANSICKLPPDINIVYQRKNDL